MMQSERVPGGFVHRRPRMGRTTACCLGCIFVLIALWIGVLVGAFYYRSTFSFFAFFSASNPALPSKPVTQSLAETANSALSSPRVEVKRPGTEDKKSTLPIRVALDRFRPKNASKPHRPALKPIWDPALVDKLAHGFDSFLVELQAKYPDDDLEVLRLRAEFATMAVCNLYNIWYSCHDNPTCVMAPTCSHRFPNDVSFKNMHDAPLRYYRQRIERREALSRLLSRMEAHFQQKNSDRVLFLMTLNSGFGFLFGNWLCSLQAQGIDVEQIKTKTLILARDNDARRYVESLGFFAANEEEIEMMTKWTETHSVAKEAAPVFGQGDHNIINLFFKFGMPLDLLSLNYTFINQDVDFVWMKNPLPEMKRVCDKEHCDAIFIAEARDFVKTRYGIGTWRSGPRPIMEFNTGLYMMKSNPSTIHTMELLMQGVFLQQWRRRDQVYYNTVLYHEKFSRLKWSILPEKTFVPGKRLHRAELLASPLLPKEELFVLHVSDTGNFILKIERLKQIGHWYFRLDTCPKPVEACRNIRSCWNSVKHAFEPSEDGNQQS